MSYTAALAPLESRSPDRLPVNELFYSIQGEGRWIGRPALFIRLNYCNLGCSWCDTKFTWQTGTIERGELLTCAEIRMRADRLRPEEVSADNVHVVLTGGEPMLHRDLLPALIDELKLSGYSFFEIETNGLFSPTPQLRERISWWNCSPKLTNNGLPLESNRNVAVLTDIASTGKADFKFVICKPSEIEEVATDYAPHLPADHIYLMAEGVSLAGQVALFPWLSREAWKCGWRYTPRLHILLWGNERKR